MVPSSRSQSPPTKRLRLDPEVYDHENPEKPEESQDVEEDIPDDLEENNCSICLQPMVDRTLVPACSHEFCFDCLMIWSEQSRRCPLCTQNMGDHVIHHIRSRYDYQKYFLPPLRSKSPQMLPMARARGPVRRRRIPREIRERSRRERQEREEADRLDHAIEKRKWIYRHQLYAKHIASNAYTRYRPYPTPAQFSVNQDLISRTTSFLRRELRVWPDLDVEFLTTFIISLMKSIDIRSESAVKLLAEFLDMDEPYVEGRRHLNAEHFAHEVYSYVRSPYKDLFVYDTVAQYDTPPDSPPHNSRSNSTYRRWERDRSRSYAPSRSRSPIRRRVHRRSLSRSRSRSLSWSPSGRNYPSTNERVRQLNRNDSPRVGHTPRSLSPRHSHSPAHVVRSSSRRRSHRSRDDAGSSKSVHSELADQRPEHTSDLRDDRNSLHRLSNTTNDGGVPAASIEPSSKAKGKARATPAIPLSESDLKGSPSAPTTTTTTTPGQRKPLPPRTRNLQESVQAHLAPSVSKSRLPKNAIPELSKSVPPSSMSVSMPVPMPMPGSSNASSLKMSLLSRLSDAPTHLDSEDQEASTTRGKLASASLPIHFEDISESPVPGPRTSLGPERSLSVSSSLHTGQSLQARLAREKEILRNARSVTSADSSTSSTSASTYHHNPKPDLDLEAPNGKKEKEKTTTTNRMFLNISDDASNCLNLEPHGMAGHADGSQIRKSESLEEEHPSHVDSTNFSSTSNRIQSNGNKLISTFSTDSGVPASSHCHSNNFSSLSSLSSSALPSSPATEQALGATKKKKTTTMTTTTVRDRLLYKLEEERRNLKQMTPPKSDSGGTSRP